MMRVNLQPILKYGIEIVSNTIMQGYPFDSHMDGWVPIRLPLSGREPLPSMESDTEVPRNYGIVSRHEHQYSIFSE